MAQSNTRTRIWKVDPSSKAAVSISQREVIISGDRSNFIAVTEKGIAIVGKSVSIVVPSENQRHGGFWIKMPDMVQMFPSTIVTLMTTSQLPFPPVAFVGPIYKDAAFFAALASAVV